MLKPLSKKTKLTEEEIKNIIVKNHELKYLIPKKKLKTVDVDLSMDVLKLLTKLSVQLKVDRDALIWFYLEKYLENT